MGLKCSFSASQQSTVGLLWCENFMWNMSYKIDLSWRCFAIEVYLLRFDLLVPSCSQWPGPRCYSPKVWVWIRSHCWDPVHGTMMWDMRYPNTWDKCLLKSPGLHLLNTSLPSFLPVGPEAAQKWTTFENHFSEIVLCMVTNFLFGEGQWSYKAIGVKDTFKLQPCMLMAQLLNP